MLEKLVLGTVQFGMKYGIANRTGKVPPDVTATILDLAQKGGVSTLDTAISYGDSEQTLGEIGVQDWNVITKLPRVPDDCPDVVAWVHTQLQGSLQRLRTSSVQTLLLHQSHQLSGPFGRDLVTALREVKQAGLVDNIGVSIYDPGELDRIEVNAFDMVQAPFNVVDRNLATSGWLQRLRDNNVQVHIRSAFLQGLLLMDRSARPAKFARWNPLWDAWNDWLQSHRITPLQACLLYALSFDGIDRVIIGVETPDQLRQILSVRAMALPPLPQEISSTDIDLINPSRW